MNVPVPAVPVPKNIPLAIAVVAIAFMCGAYLLFLWASWQQYQRDRNLRDERIDELLARLPAKKAAAE